MNMRAFGKRLKITGTILTFSAFLAMVWSGVASAHVVVRPAQAGTAAFQAFTIGVPTEGNSPTVRVRLLVPDGVGHVTPNVKAGWQIDTVRQGAGDDAEVTEIIWSGGAVPVGQRDDFGFTAQMPAEAATLQWKAYQTYADGRVVSWDRAPGAEGHGEESDGGPYSETAVSDDMSNDADNAAASHTDQSDQSGNDTRSNIAIGVAIVALVLAVIAVTQGRAQPDKSKK